LGTATVQAIADWLEVKPVQAGEIDPLFTALDLANPGHRLTDDGIRKIVVRHSKNAGIKKQMSPHRIRHSAITVALDATDGNVRKVQKLRRHIASLNHFLCTILMNFGKIKFMFLSEELKQKFDNLKRPT